MSLPRFNPNSLQQTNSDGVDKYSANLTMQSNINNQLFQFNFLEPAINEFAEIVQVPNELAFATVLASISTVCQRMLKVRLPTSENIVKPVSLFVISPADSGERKSSLEGKIFKPIKEFELEQRRQYSAAVEIWERDFELWNMKCKKLKSSIISKAKKDKCIDDENSQLEKLLSNKPIKPKLLKLIYEDATSEAYYSGLAMTFPSAVLMSSEGSIILNSRLFNDFAKICALWSGDPVTIDRKSTDSFVLDNVCSTVFIMVQKEILDIYLEKKGRESLGSGLWSRALIFEPKSKNGTRFIQSNTSYPQHNICKYYTRINELLKINLSSLNNPEFKPDILQFSDSAAAIWVNFYNHIEQQISKNNLYENAGDHASKLAENVARVAALFQFFDGVGHEIKENYVHAAIYYCCKSSEYYLKRFVPKSILELDATLLNDWLVSKGNSGICYISKAQLRRSGPNKLRDKNKRFDDALIFLENCNYIKTVSIDRKMFIDLYPNCYPKQQPNNINTIW